MKTRLFSLLALLTVAILVVQPWGPSPQAQGRSGDQQMARTRFVGDGVTANGTGVIQTGEVSTLSAEVTNTTVTQVVAAPAAGLSIYVRGIVVTKSVAATGAVTLVYGTGTNCGTGTTTLLTISGATSNSLLPGYIPLGILVPAAKALCLNTEAAGTGVRALTN